MACPGTRPVHPNSGGTLHADSLIRTQQLLIYPAPESIQEHA